MFYLCQWIFNISDLPNQSNAFVLFVVRNRHYVLGNYFCLERILVIGFGGTIVA